MSDGVIQAPAKGQPLRASWASEISRRVNENTRELSSVRGAGVPENIRSRNAPHPFEVVGRTEDDGSAGFSIYLPSGCIVVGDSPVTPGGVSAIQGTSDRYSVDQSELSDLPTSAGSAKELNLVVVKGSSVTAKITCKDEEPGDGEECLAVIPIARVWKTENGEGNSIGCVYVQLVRSSIALGTGTGGGGGSSETKVVDVVVGATYDTYTHEFKLDFKRLTVLAEETSSKTDAERLVFTATSHAAEH